MTSLSQCLIYEKGIINPVPHLLRKTWDNTCKAISIILHTHDINKMVDSNCYLIVLLVLLWSTGMQCNHSYSRLGPSMLAAGQITQSAAQSLIGAATFTFI